MNNRKDDWGVENEDFFERIKFRVTISDYEGISQLFGSIVSLKLEDAPAYVEMLLKINNDEALLEWLKIYFPESMKLIPEKNYPDLIKNYRSVIEALEESAIRINEYMKNRELRKKTWYLNIC